MHKIKLDYLTINKLFGFVLTQIYPSLSNHAFLVNVKAMKSPIIYATFSLRAGFLVCRTMLVGQ